MDVRSDHGQRGDLLLRAAHVFDAIDLDDGGDPSAFLERGFVSRDV